MTDGCFIEPTATASQVVPTGLSAPPPPGPAMPLTATAMSEPLRLSTPSAISSTTGSLTDLTLQAIADNAGAKGSVVVAKIEDSTETSFGYNALTDTFEDLVKAGVITPAKVDRSALQNAASVAGLLLTTDVLVTEVPEKKKSPMPPGGMDDFD